MLNIVGYSDKHSVTPGDTVTFYVSSTESESFTADIVRLIHGDTNPEGPGYKEEEIAKTSDKEYPGRPQDIHIGSYAIVPHDPRFDVSSFSMQAMIFPTSPEKGVQGIMGTWY